MEGEPPREELEAACCWEAVDRVAHDPTMTAFRRRLRLHQARWREAAGHPMGTQPIEPKGSTSRPLGSRLPLAYAIDTRANFLTEGAADSAVHRLASAEPHQTLNPQRLWADLLSSMPMCFNLFGDLRTDLDLADDVVHVLWPDAPGRVVAVRFEHSPGRLDPEFLQNRSAFDVAFELDLGAGELGILGIETKYHEAALVEHIPENRRRRYEEVADRSGAFRPGVVDTIAAPGSRLPQLWLDHLLVFAMLQHPTQRWTWGRFVVIHPQGNTSFSECCNAYTRLLAGSESFAVLTLESLLDAGVLPSSDALRRRYLPTSG